MDIALQIGLEITKLIYLRTFFSEKLKNNQLAYAQYIRICITAMNIQILPTDTLIYILSYIEGKSLLQLVRICRPIQQIIMKIITEAMRDDMDQYLFLFNELSVDTLKKYLHNMKIVCMIKIAHLVLAAVTLNNPQFVATIIKYLDDGSHDYSNGTSIDFYDTPICAHNIFFSSIDDIDKITILIDYRYCFHIWLQSILDTNRLDILCKMYSFTFNPDCVKKYEILSYLFVLSRKSDYNGYHEIVRYLHNIPHNDENSMLKFYNTMYSISIRKYIIFSQEFIRKMISDDNSTIGGYLARNKIKFADRNRIKTMNPYLYIMLHTGHLKLFIEIFKIIHPKNYLRDFYQEISACLLQHNHIDQYKIYSQMMLADPHCQRKIKVLDIVNGLNKPSDATIDFCIKEFGTNVSLPGYYAGKMKDVLFI